MSKFFYRGALLGILAFAFVVSIGNEASAVPAVEYVKVCSIYGQGTVYVPGAGGCIRIGGYVRSSATEVGTGTVCGGRYFTSGTACRSRDALSIDTRTCSDTGVVRTYFVQQGNNCLSAPSAAGLNSPPSIWTSFGQPTPGAYNWSGFYVGGNGGGAWSPSRNIFVNETSNHDPFFDGAFGARNVQGGFGGGHVGYRSQHGNWVLGGELNAQWGSINGSSHETFMPYLSPGNSMTFRTEECMDFFSTLTGRVGYAIDRTLLYATAGAAVANTNIHFKMMDTFGFDAAATSKALRGGYAVGGGVEHAFDNHWSVRAEYELLDFGKAQISGPEFFGTTPSAFNIYNTTRIVYSTLALGVSYRFGEPGSTALTSLGR